MGVLSILPRLSGSRHFVVRIGPLVINNIILPISVVAYTVRR